MKTTSKKLTCFAISVLIAIFSGISVFGAKPAAKTLKVGYIDYQSFIDKAPDGTYSGYGVDYLSEVAKYADFEYEYVYGTWQECLTRLENKEIDLVCTAKYTPQRDETFEYSKFPIGTEQGVLYTLPENSSLYYDDFIGLNGAAIGFLKGNLTIEAFRDYAENNNFVFTEKYYATEDEMKKALVSKEISAIATEHMSLHDDLKLIGKYGSEPFYLMSYDGNNFMKEMNLAVGKIKLNNKDFEAQLNHKYYSATKAESTPAFTREEISYIDSCDVITVGSLPNRYPLSSVNKSTKELEGITVDIVKKIGEVSGLNFDVSPMPVDKKPMDLLREGKFDMVAGIVINDTFLHDSSLRLSTPFLTSNIAIATRHGSVYDPNRAQNVTTKVSFQAMQDYISKTHPNYNIVYKSNDDQCLQAVMDGEADIMLQNVYVLNYLLQNPHYDGLEIVPAYYLEENTGFATLSDVDPRLISIIDKSIATLSDDVLSQLVTDNTLGKPYKMTLSDVIFKYKLLLTLIAILVCVCIGLLALTAIIKQKSLKQINLKNTELVKAIAQAEQASSAKSQFLARMSHEIRTPMNAIVGLTTITKQHVNSPEQVMENMDKISTASKILLNLINDVLDMSAIENSKLKIAAAPFDFKQLMQSITLMYYGQCRQKNIEFSAKINTITDEVLIGDSLRVHQILLNLLSNAVKFTPSGGKITVSVTQTPHNKSQTFIRFVVSDTGCGMTTEMMSRVFNPFEQETASTAQRYGGSGLGMSITKNLVDLMHGAIAVESEKGVGTTFSVDLPFGIPEKRQEYISKKFEDLNALIVDDDQETCEYTSIVLSRLNVPHEYATSGEEALTKIRNSYTVGKGYDLCFIDWRMPEMDGITLTKKIRAEFDNDTIIIIVSAYDLSEVESEAVDAGANLFVTKPVFQSTVFNMLTSLSGGKYIEGDKSGDEYDFKGHRVLLVEDNALNMEIATELLKVTGIDVDPAENGKIAFDKFERSPEGYYDIVLMDIQMPIMDGHASTRAIRSGNHPQAKTIPIFAMTANAFTEDVALALSAGMNGHISKPIDTGIMYDVIARVLQKQ